MESDSEPQPPRPTTRISKIPTPNQRFPPVPPAVSVEELAVTRDRADALERLLEQSGVLNSTQLDEYEADDVAAAERQARRERYVARIMKTFSDEAARESGDLMAPSFEEVVRIMDK